MSDQMIRLFEKPLKLKLCDIVFIVFIVLYLSHYRNYVLKNI